VSSVYSTRFIAVQGLVGETDYVVPAGVVAVIRQIDMWQSAFAAAPESAVGIKMGGTYVRILELFSEPLTNVNLHWSGRQVAYPGESIFAVQSSLSPDVMVSGYLLTLP
jgi:hypothetical protein